MRADGALVSPKDMNIPIILPDGPAIVEAIRKHHAQWNQRHG